MHYTHIHAHTYTYACMCTRIRSELSLNLGCFGLSEMAPMEPLDFVFLLFNRHTAYPPGSRSKS